MRWGPTTAALAYGDIEDFSVREFFRQPRNQALETIRGDLDLDNDGAALCGMGGDLHGRGMS